MLRFSLLVMCLGAMSASAEPRYNPYPGPSAPEVVQDTLWAFVEDTRHLFRGVEWMQKAYPRAEHVVILETERGALSTPLRELLVARVTVRQTSGYEDEGLYGRPLTQTTVIQFTKWPWTFHESTVALHQLWNETRSAHVLQDQFYRVHAAYERAVVATYLLMDSIKRQYELDERTRANLFALHQRATRAMNWMLYLRKAQPYSALVSERFFARGDVWEERFGAVYGLGMADENWKQAFFDPNANVGLEPLIVPLLPKNEQARWMPRASAAAGDGYAALRKEWEEIQNLLKDPANRDDRNLRQRLWELQRLLTPGVTVESPGEAKPSNLAPPPDPRSNPAPQPAPAPPAEPEAVERNPKIHQAILKLQYLLGKPEVQNQPELRRALEELLQELRPGLPPLKPLPPTEENEEERPAPKTMTPPRLARFR